MLMSRSKLEDIRASRKRQSLNIIKVCTLIMFVSGIIMAVFFALKWAQNPELTQMQFFLENYWNMILISILIGVGVVGYSSVK